MKVEVAYVDSQGKAHLRALNLDGACTLLKAVQLSNLITELPDELADFANWLNATKPDDAPNHKYWLVGVFSHKKPLNYLVEAGDRIEIYRPLTLDPMNNRKNNVAKARKARARAQSQGNKTQQKTLAQ